MSNIFDLGYFSKFLALIKLPEKIRIDFVGDGLNGAIEIFHHYRDQHSRDDCGFIPAEISGDLLIKEGIYQLLTDPLDVRLDAHTQSLIIPCTISVPISTHTDTC